MKKATALKPKSNRWLECGMLLIVVLLSTALPRLMLSGGLPATDEGYYAYQALLIHHSFATGHGLPNIGTLALYPMLLAWVFELQQNAIIVLRLADLCVSSVMTALLYRVLAHEASSKLGAAGLTLIFAFTLNQHLFIQYGFKNSITVAFVPLLLALRLAQKGNSQTWAVWWFAGALTALSVLLRETFISFALLGFVALFFSRGRGPALHFGAGVSATGCLIVALMLLARGGVSEAIQSYREAGVVYSSIADQRLSLFISNGKASVQVATVALGCSVVAFFILMLSASRSNRRRSARRFVFWLLVAAVPLIEPITKIGFPYHFAVSLVGLAGLCALAWREASLAWPYGKRLAEIASVVAIVLLAGKYSFFLQNWPATHAAIAASPSGRWPADMISKSNYLLAADTIEKVLPVNGTLSISGFMFTLYPLTRHLPPTPEFVNLSATMIIMNLSTTRLQEALQKCPPEVIMTTTRTDWPGKNELKAAIEGSGFYEQVADIPLSTDRSYGNFGGSIFRKTATHACVR